LLEGPSSELFAKHAFPDDHDTQSNPECNKIGEKVCFAYCALFPTDYKFEKEHLIELWMTEDFPQHGKSPEETGQQYFNELLSRSFFQRSGDAEEVFVMHDLLNDLAKYVAGDIYFRCELGQTNEIQKVSRHFLFELGNVGRFHGFGTLCKTQRLQTFLPTPDRKMHFFYWFSDMSIHVVHQVQVLAYLIALSLF